MLTPIYKPCSWSVDKPVEIEDTPEMREAQKALAERMQAAIEGRFEKLCTANVPRRPAAADYLGDEYDPSLSFDAIRFEMEMLKP